MERKAHTQKIHLFSHRTGILQTCTDIASNVNRFGQGVWGLETVPDISGQVVLRGKSTTAGNKKMRYSTVRMKICSSITH